MFMISIVELPRQRRLILEGKLMAPWAHELRTACEKAKADLHGRDLIVDMKNITTISQEGENVLLELMNEGVKFRCCGLFTRHFLRQLFRRTRKQIQEAR